MRSTSSLSLAVQAAAQIDALVALSRDAAAPAAFTQHAELLARALALVSRRHLASSSQPARARATTLAALEELRIALQQHETFALAGDDGGDATKATTPQGELGATQLQLLEGALLALWANVATYALLVALGDLVAAVDFIPHALRYWKTQRRRPVRAIIQSGPFEWIQPDHERITIDERIYSLETTLNAVLTKLGNIKELTTRLLNTSADDAHQLRGLVADNVRVLERAYNSSGVVPPRRGKGAFKTLQPLRFTAIHYAPCVTESEAGQVTVSSVRLCLSALNANVGRFMEARAQFESFFAPAMAPCRVPSKLRQRWLHLTVTAACIATGAVWVVRNQREFQEALKKAKSATNEFFTEHMIEPMQAIVGELVLNQKPEIQDAAALQDTKDSLRRMLADLLKDKHPSMPSPEVQRVLKDMDMSVVSLQYEKELGSAVRNLMSGDIVRMLLIQVQFIKKELMVAMGAIDELMHANQLNLQMMATVPTFILFGGLYKLTKELFYQVYKRTSERLFYDPGEIAGFFRNILRDIERLLNKQNRPAELDENMLDARDMGLLLLLLHQLRDVFDSNRELFDEDEQQRFDEDLNDLIEEGLLVSQQLAVIQRMHHSHPFLQRTKSRRWLLN